MVFFHKKWEREGGLQGTKVVKVKELYKRFHSSINGSLKFSGTAAPPHMYAVQVAYLSRSILKSYQLHVAMVASDEKRRPSFVCLSVQSFLHLGLRHVRNHFDENVVVSGVSTVVEGGFQRLQSSY